MTKNTVTAFCPAEQKDTEHSLALSGTGEVVLTCITDTGTADEPNPCGSFFKMPKGSTVTDIKTYIAKARSSSQGQVLQDTIVEIEQSLIEGLNTEE